MTGGGFWSVENGKSLYFFYQKSHDQMHFEVQIFKFCLGFLKDISWEAVATAGQEAVSQGEVQ